MKETRKRVGETEAESQDQDEKKVRWRKGERKTELEAETEIQRGCGGDDREGRKGGRDGRQRGMAVYLSSQIN